MDKDKNKEIIVLICCLIASFALWLYISNVENPTITYEIKNIPVTIKNTEKLSYNNLILAENKEYYTNLKIRGSSSVVRNAKKSDFKVTADLDAYVLKTGKNTIPVKIEEYPEEISVQDERYVITVNLDELIEKSIPVEVAIKGNPPEGYYVGTPIVRPTNIVVSGAARNVNAVEKLKAEINVESFTSDTQLTSTVRPVDMSNRTIEDVKIDKPVVDVLVPIDTVKKVKVEVVSSGNVEKNLQLEGLIPSINEVKIAGKNDVIENIESIKTEAVDLTGIKENTTLEVPLIIPSGVTILEDNEKIEVKIQVEKIIEKETSYNISINNLSDDMEAKLETSAINIKIRGKESIISNFDFRNIECYVDLKELKEGTHIVPITINTPQNIEVVYTNINSVKVEITLKSTETNAGRDSDNKTKENDVKGKEANKTNKVEEIDDN